MTDIPFAFEPDVGAGGPLVSVFTVFHAKPELQHRLLFELRQLMRSSRQESGCLLFDLFRINGDPRGFALSEVWIDPAAKLAHERAFHSRRFLIEASPFLEDSQEIYSLEELL